MSIEAPPLERKLVAIVAADVARYSRVVSDEEGAPFAADPDTFRDGEFRTIARIGAKTLRIGEAS